MGQPSPSRPRPGSLGTFGARLATAARRDAALVKTFAALVVAHALVDSCSNVWPVFKKLAGLDLYWAGLLSTATTFVAAMAQPLFGLWADRGRRRPLLLAGVTLPCLAMLLGPIGGRKEVLSPATLYGSLFAVLMVVSIGLAMFHPPGASLIGDASARRRSTFVSLFIAVGAVGFAGSQLMFSGVYRATGGRTDYLLLPMGLLVLGIAAWFRPPERRASGRLDLRQTWADIASVRRPLTTLYLVMALVSALSIGLLFLLPEFVQARGYPEWMVNGGATLFYVFGSVITMVPIGHLADHLGRRRLLVAALAVSVASYYGLVLTPPLPTPLFALLCLVAGGCMGPPGPLGIALAQQLAPGNASMISGVMMGWAWALGSFAPWAVGYLAKQPTLGPVGALACLGGVLVAGWGLAVSGLRDEGGGGDQG